MTLALFLTGVLGVDLFAIGVSGMFFGPTFMGRIAAVVTILVAGLTAIIILPDAQRDAAHLIVIACFQALVAVLGWCSTQSAESFFAPRAPLRRRQRFPRF